MTSESHPLLAKTDPLQRGVPFAIWRLDWISKQAAQNYGKSVASKVETAVRAAEGWK